MTADFTQFDPEVLATLRSHADTIMERLLQRREQLHPRASEPVHFPRGTVGFNTLHWFADTPRLLIALLNEATGKLTQDEDRLWCVSEADPALAAARGKSVQIALHPHDVLVNNLDAVPPDVRIFCLETTQPHGIYESAAFSAAQIKSRRDGRPEHTLRRRWDDNRVRIHDRWLPLIRAEFDRQSSKMSSDTRKCIAVALNRAASGTYDIEALLEVASHLGVLWELLPGIVDPPAK